MFFKKVILHKFKRFAVDTVETFIVEPLNGVNVLSWKNGYGKSSFLSQLTPLPADLNKDYFDGGYKELHIEHNNDNYIIISGINGTKKHSFIKNDIELNDSGTITIQRQLAEEHFGITNEINDILLGKIEFVNMSPALRKEYLNYICPIDMEYGINIYNKIKEDLNSCKSYHKLFTNNVSKYLDIIKNIEVNDVASIEEINSIKIKIEKYRSIGYQYLNSEKQENILNKLEVHLNTYETLENKMYNLLNISNLDFESISNDKYKYTLEIEKENIQKRILLLSSKIKEYDECNLVIERTKNFKNEYKTLKTELDIIGIDTSNIQLYKDYLKHIFNFFDLLEDTLEMYNQYINDYEIIEDDLDKNKITILTEEINNININIITHKNSIIQINNIIKELEESNNVKVKCPNCSHKWIVSNNESINHLKEELSKKNIEIVNLEKQLKNKNNYLNKVKELYTKLEQCSSYYKDYIYVDNIKHFNEYIVPKPNLLLEADLLTISNYLVNLKFKLELDLNNFDRMNRILSLIEENEKYLLSKNINSDLLENEKKELETLVIRNNQINKELTTLEELFKIKQRLEETKINMKNNLTKLRIADKSVIVTERIAFADYLLSDLNNLQRKTENKIIDIKYNEKLLEEAKTNLETNKIKTEDLNILENILSPKTGLVGLSINSFLNVFINDINNLIERIWSYDLRLLPIDLTEETELTYKFKVQVNNDFIVEDISKLSSSMQEIVNLAFKLGFMKYTRLHNYVLFLDEFGRTMDLEHRDNAFSMIDEYLINNYPQIFLVCHFESMYARFKNENFIELKEYK